jgi:hypothetical protein
MIQCHVVRAERACGTGLAKRRSQIGKSLVLLEAPGADDDEVGGADAVPLPHDRASAGPASAVASARSMPFGTVRIRPGAGFRWRATVASSATSVAMMQLAAFAHRRTAHGEARIQPS